MAIFLLIVLFSFSFHFISFHFISFLLFFIYHKYKIDSNIAIQCLSLFEDHALWKAVSTGEVARDFLFLYFFFFFPKKKKKKKMESVKGIMEDHQLENVLKMVHIKENLM